VLFACSGNNLSGYNHPMPRIAIPLPHSADPEYAARSIPQYEQAVQLAGGEPIRIPLDQSPEEIKKLIATCDAVLLPGSKADVDPARYGAARSLRSAAPDPGRDAVDDLLLEDAYTNRKPVLGICYGLQSLNVFRGGSLVQHIPDFLPEDLRALVNHEAGAKVPVAHEVKVDQDSNLARILGGETRSPKPGDRGPFVFPVNSSHHQSAEKIGGGLRLVARCTADNIVEAVEGTNADHFVLAVQWHPERSVDNDEPSRVLFRALIAAARENHSALWQPASQERS
jgi:putative glutamine amidotransferase